MPTPTLAEYLDPLFWDAILYLDSQPVAWLSRRLQTLTLGDLVCALRWKP